MLKKLGILLYTSLLLMTGCTSGQAKEETLKQLQPPKDGEEIVVMTTNMGTVKFKLFPDEAPKAVKNFKELIEEGYYNNVTFHRVINDFMIQSGDPSGTGSGGKNIYGENGFEDEFSLDLHNFRGALSMANSGPNTNGSQFFIVQAKTIPDNMAEEMKAANENEDMKGSFSPQVVEAYQSLGGTPWLDYHHTVFGQVIEGMDVVDAIAAVETGENDKPKTDVSIDKIEVIKYEQETK